MKHLIDKDILVAEIERRISQLESKYKELSNLEIWITAKEIKHKINGLKEALSIINTLEVKEVNIADMADDYYDALMKEADWMDEGTIGHCRLAYYNGCKDVLNKIQKGE